MVTGTATETEIMFKHVMVATDLSVDSDEMVGRLAGLAGWGIDEIDLVYASSFIPHDSSFGTTESRQAIREDRERRLMGRLAAQERRLTEQGFLVSSHHVIGRAEETLSKLAGKLGVDLMVVGIRRTSLARNIVLGSTAVEILRLSEVPVLLVRPEAGVPVENGPIGGGGKRRRAGILFATDFSAAANGAYRILRDLARSRQVAVTVFHSAAGVESVAPCVIEHLRKLASGIRKTGSEVRVVLGAGDPAMEIPAACDRTGVSLLVMGTNGKGVVGEFFVGSVSQAVARRIEIPVLLVRGTREIRWAPTGGNPGKDRGFFRLRSHRVPGSGEVAGSAYY